MMVLSEYARLMLYPLLALASMYGALYFFHFRWLFWAMANLFVIFGVGLFVLKLGLVEWNTWIRTWLVLLAQILLLSAFVRTFWRSHKWLERGDK